VSWLGLIQALDPRQVDLNGYKCSKSAYFLTEKALRVPRAFPIAAQIDSIELWKAPLGYEYGPFGGFANLQLP